MFCHNQFAILLGKFHSPNTTAPRSVYWSILICLLANELRSISLVFSKCSTLSGEFTS
nr:MAG TPA: hypothetical protein [Podoviridae sp. ctY3D12]